MENYNQVEDLLLKNIVIAKRRDHIHLDGLNIKTGQVYKSSLDHDMTDLAVEFYQILYKDILPNKILSIDGYLNYDDFAGDTMNSFNYTANRTLGAGKSKKTRTAPKNWPRALQEYYDIYHSLANYWLLPKILGRSLKKDVNGLNKAQGPNYDYMDRFLLELKENFALSQYTYEYFFKFKDWEDFCRKNFLIEAYVDENFNVIKYSLDGSNYFLSQAIEKIKIRARLISKSDFGPILVDKFQELGLIKFNK